jgi:hypothetical protein
VNATPATYWDQVQSQLAQEWRVKVEQGQVEHGGHFPTKPGMLAHLKAEAYDQITYALNLERQIPILARTLANLAVDYNPTESEQLAQRIEVELRAWLLEPRE